MNILLELGFITHRQTDTLTHYKSDPYNVDLQNDELWEGKGSNLNA